MYDVKIGLISSLKNHTLINAHAQPWTQKRTISVMSKDVRIINKIVVNSIVKE